METVDFRLGVSIASLVTGLEAAERKLDLFGRNAKKALEIGAGAFVGKEILSGIESVIDKGKEWEASNNRIIGLLKATGGAAGVTKGEIEEMAETLSRTSLADDDAIKDVSTTLLKFGNIQEDVFKRAVKSSLDLAGVMNNDFSGAAQKLGQALASPELGLKGLQQEIGKLNPAQKDAIDNFIRMGDLTGAQNEILKILEQRVGGLAQQLNTGLSRSTKEASQAWDDFLKTIARTEAFQVPVNSFLGFIKQSLTDISTIVEKGDWVEKLLASAAFLAGFRGFDLKLGDNNSPEAAGDAEKDAAAKKREEERQALLKALAQRTASARMAAARAAAASELEAERNLGTQRQEVLDLYNERSLLSIASYYEARGAIQRAAITAEIAAIDKSVAAQEAAIGSLKEPEQLIAARTAINTELAKRVQLENQLGSTAVVNTLKEQKANEDLRDAMLGVNIEIARQKGLLAAAAGSEFDIQNKMLRRQAANNPSLVPFAESDIAELRALKIARAAYDEQQLQSGAILDTLSAKETTIEALRKQGAITDFEALRRTGDLRGQQVVQLQQIAENMLVIAQSSSNPQLIASAEQFKARIDDLAASVDLLGQRARTTFEDGFTGFLDAAIGRTKSLKDAVADMFTDIGRQLLHLQNQQIAQSIFGTNGPAGAVPGLFAGGSLSGAVRNLFSPSAAAEPVGFSAEQLTRLGDVAQFDVGTDFVPRTGLAVIHKGEQIIPAGDRGGRGGVTMNVTINAPGADIGAVQRIGAGLAQLERRVVPMVKDAQRRSR